MNIYVLEYRNNKEIYNYLKGRYNISHNIFICDVIIINKVRDVKSALEIVDFALMNGKEIICIKNPFSKEGYLSNYLIRNGAFFV